MGVLAFDTHKAVKVLQDAGADEHLAEAVVNTIGSAMGENVATKVDIAELKADIAELEAATKADIAELKASTQADIAELKASTQADIAELKTATKAEIAELKVWLLGHLWVAVGVIIAALSLLAYLFLPTRPG